MTGSGLLMVEEERKRNFGEALSRVLASKSVTQRELGERLGGTAQSVISAWTAGQYEPSSDTVFEVERVLEVPPGHLSQHLGYFPPEAVKKPGVVNFEAVVLDDPLLDDTMKNGLIAQYWAWTSRRKGRRPR